ncbi:MAG TPA: GNAT family N-acetyltransferase [Solirubrobacteraceae bacterium]
MTSACLPRWPVGAAWWRFFTDEDHGYGFIEPPIPELSVAVTEGLRGRGVGGALLEALIERARDADLPALSLSVEVDNPALRLYERLGFTAVAHDGNAWTMRRDTRGA